MWILGLKGLNKSQCMNCPPEKVAIVDRWPLVEVWHIFL